ncbi:CAAD domain-containing protein [Synechococcus sp. M16CYN]
MEPSDDPRQVTDGAENAPSPAVEPVSPSFPTTRIDPIPPVDTKPASDTTPVPMAADAAVDALLTAETVPDPMIATTVTIPAQKNGVEDVGEWGLLSEKVKTWIDAEGFSALWVQAQLPLRVVGGLILFMLLSTVYNGILGIISKVPLAPGLLELTGLIWLAVYARRNLVRSSDRKQVADTFVATWNKVVGH